VAIMLHGFTDFNLQITANAVYFVTLAMLGAAVLAAKGGGDTDSPGSPFSQVGQKNGDTASDGGHDRDGDKNGQGRAVAFERAHGPGTRGAAKAARRRTLSGIRWLAAGLLAVIVFVPALRDFLGFHHLAVYRRLRSEARSVESVFPALEARLQKAMAASPLAVFRVETARLFMEMARVANETGREEERDTLCDRAVAAYGRAIAANPIDSAILYETGTAYLFYNFPLMTYQDRAKAYFRAALAAKPADATINLNVLFLYFNWWPTLEDADRSYAAATYRAMAARDPAFPGELEARWTRSFGSADGLRAVLAELPR
jgi:hypothetical protein